MRTSRILRVLILTLFVTSFFIAAIDHCFAKKRPKIALVLGGGGARGGAHLGVIRVLEENNIPIDMIIGTSMGSIVGGLYAAGISPDGVQEFFEEIDWVGLFQDRPSEEYLHFRRKLDQERLMSFEMGVKDGDIEMPRGVIAGQKLGFELKKLFLPTSHITDFDKLSIPFRAVSADLGTGEAVVHSKGNLSDAIRASISIPGVFPPVELDGRILVDGGIVNNVPVEVAKEMGADIIIAVDVGSPLGDPKEIKSMIGVAMQMIGILGKRNVQDSLALLTDKDILITPELGDIRTETFVRVLDAADAGEKSARKHIVEIRRYSVSDREFEQYLKSQRKYKTEPVKVDFIKVADSGRAHPESITRRIKTQPGETLDYDKLQQDLTRVYAIGDFETVNFSVVEEDDQTGLLIDAKEKPWGPNYLYWGLNLSSGIKGDSEYTLLMDYRMTQLNKLGAEWRNVLQIGETRGVMSEWYQPLDLRDYWFVMPKVTVERDNYDIYSGDNKIAEYRVDYIGGGLGFGVNFSSVARLMIGAEKATIDAKPETGGTGLPSFDDTESGAYFGELIFDQLDNHIFPKNGIQAGVHGFISDSSLGSDITYKKLYFNALKATTWGKHTLIGGADFGWSINDDTPFYDQFTLGGFMNLSGYGENQLRGQHSTYAALLYYYKLGNEVSSFSFGNDMYIGCGFEMGNVWNNTSDIDIDDFLYGGVVFLGWDTPIGPLYVGYGITDKGQDDGRFYLFLGKTF